MSSAWSFVQKMLAPLMHRFSTRRTVLSTVPLPIGRCCWCALAFPLQTDPVFMRDSHPGEARKGFFEDEEDTAHDRSDY